MKLNELMNLENIKKHVDPKEMRRRVIAAHGNPFGDSKKKKDKKEKK